MSGKIESDSFEGMPWKGFLLVFAPYKKGKVLDLLKALIV
jgi:hypothetical protein